MANIYPKSPGALYRSGLWYQEELLMWKCQTFRCDTEGFFVLHCEGTYFTPHYEWPKNNLESLKEILPNDDHIRAPTRPAFIWADCFDDRQDWRGNNTISIRSWAWMVTLQLGKNIMYSSRFQLQSTLSKADTLGTKATVRFREVSGLESVRLERVDCKPIWWSLISCHTAVINYLLGKLTNHSWMAAIFALQRLCSFTDKGIGLGCHTVKTTFSDSDIKL